MILHDDPLCTLYLGDCVEVMAELPAESVDAIVTDPPYGLEFMGKGWDRLDYGLPQENVWKGRRGKGGSSVGTDDSKPASRHHVSFGSSSRAQFKRCSACGKRQFSGTPCKCDAPEWVIEHAPPGPPSGQIRMQRWHEAWAREAFRVAKPGAHLLAFGGTRTYHRLASAIEDAGWEIRDCLVYAYAQGFPKSLNVAKQEGFCHCERSGSLPPEHDLRDVPSEDVSDAEGFARGQGPVLLAAMPEPRLPAAALQPEEGQLWPSERLVEGRGDLLQDEGQLRRGQVRQGAGVGEADGPQGRLHHGAPADRGSSRGAPAESNGSGEPHRPPPGEQRPDESGAVADQRRPQARGGWPLCDRCGEPKVDGWGTALKPAWEPIVMARKPLRGTVAANVLAHGTGALNIDATRIGTDAGWSYPNGPGGSEAHHMERGEPKGNGQEAQAATAGRWPANLILTDPIFDGDTPGVVGGGNASTGGAPTDDRGHGGIWQDGDGAPAGPQYGDSGTYSRFFLIPKSSRSDREPVLRGHGLPEVVMDIAGQNTPEGREGRGVSPTVPVRANSHPTVKPLDLMRHLVRLVTPPGGTVLDCFLGSGTTAIAANAEGFRCIGIEKEREYLDIALARMAHQPLGLGLDVAAPTRKRTTPSDAKMPPVRFRESGTPKGWSGGWDEETRTPADGVTE